MPCTGPTPEEWKKIQEYNKKMKSDPEFAREEKLKELKSKYEWEHGGKEKHEKYLREIKEKEKKIKEEKIKREVKKGELEYTAFDSFMAVFLCKAMKLIESNNLMQFTYVPMEWWFDEHKKRDSGDFSTPKEEIVEKLLEIKEYFHIK